jgi:AraC-like DNA-binding protein
VERYAPGLPDASPKVLDPPAELLANGVTEHAITQQLLRRVGSRLAGVSRDQEDTNRRLLRARDRIDRKYAEPLDVTQLAAVAYLTRSHFIREFKRVFGETPYRYLQRRRVERAMFLLRHTDRSVTDVCTAVGFTCLGTFSRTFSQIVGQSPSVYRAAVAEENRVAPTSFAMRWSRPVGGREKEERNG